MFSITFKFPFSVKIAESFFEFFHKLRLHGSSFRIFYSLTSNLLPYPVLVIGPSPESSNARLFSPSLVNLYFCFLLS